MAKRIGDRIETLMWVYAHSIPTDNRDTAAKVNAIHSGSEKETAPAIRGGEKQSAQRTLKGATTLPRCRKSRAALGI